MDPRTELGTITATLEELTARVAVLVEAAAHDERSDLYSELVAAERSLNTLLRRLRRTASQHARP